MKRVLVIHGPNLNLLGQYETDSYGSATLQEVNAELASWGTRWQIEISACQSNHEGDLVTWIQAAGFGENAVSGAVKAPDPVYDGIIINAAGYAYTGTTLRDAIDICPLPIVEVVISSKKSRGANNNSSLLAPVCVGQISGSSKESYISALFTIGYLLGAIKLDG